jgi:hypothetical protein
MTDTDNTEQIKEETLKTIKRALDENLSYIYCFIYPLNKEGEPEKLDRGCGAYLKRQHHLPIMILELLYSIKARASKDDMQWVIDTLKEKLDMVMEE